MNSSHTHFIKESFATAKAKSSYSKYIWLLILLIVIVFTFVIIHFSGKIIIDPYEQLFTNVPPTQLEKFKVNMKHPVFNVNLLKLSKNHPADIYETDTGIVGNNYDNTVIRKKDKLYVQKRGKLPLFPLKHNSFTVDKNGYKYLNKKHGNRYYVRYINGSGVDHFLRNIIQYDIPHGWVNSSVLMSNKGAYTNMHIDNLDGIMVQISGAKRWFVWEPKWREKLEMISNLRSIKYSNRLTKQELLDMPPHIEIIAKRGDAIYIPKNYPHIVETLDNYSITVGFRRLNTFKA
mgnify:CR=1 FL=1|jgi:hypothetical protein